MKYALLLLAFSAGVLSLMVHQHGSPTENAVFAAAPLRTEQDLKVQIKELRGELEKLHSLVPDQAAVMTHVGYHWSNLWFAIEQENWPLADFYLSETRNNVKWAVRAKPFRKSGPYIVDLGKIAEALDTTQFTQLKQAIASKNRKTCVKLYDEALTGCYACHKASDKPYPRPQRPTQPEVRVINFDPRAKKPE